jgi:hypothetical protein
MKIMPAIFVAVIGATVFWFSTPLNADNVADHVSVLVNHSCRTGAGFIDVTLVPRGQTQIPGPPGITVLQDKDTGVEWKTALPYYVETSEEYFAEQPTIQLSYLVGPQEMPLLVADFAYCPTVEECLFATERIKVQNTCR